VEPGLSVVVTTWNGARRLPGTLQSLLDQEPPGVPWEVLVVDNASTDGSAQAARDAWPVAAPVPLRVLFEPRQGVKFANHCGLAAARYALLALVNDDNRPEPGYLRTATEFMAAHPGAAAVGSRGIAAAEAPLPPWFPRFELHYAVGDQSHAAGPIEEPRQGLWGACSIYRTEAWRGLLAKGFAPHDVGRRGADLLAGEDYELCYALRLAGFSAWYEPRLAFRHFIEARKLDWRWHRRMQRGFGASIALDPYVLALDGRDGPGAPPPSWAREAARTSTALLRFSPHVLFGDRLPGDPAVARADQLLGRLRALLSWRSGYERFALGMRDAAWRRRPSATS
jgi:glycosyltransferase involved in cell wall biosynthesis